MTKNLATITYKPLSNRSKAVLYHHEESISRIFCDGQQCSTGGRRSSELPVRTPDLSDSVVVSLARPALPTGGGQGVNVASFQSVLPRAGVYNFAFHHQFVNVSMKG